MFLVKIYSKYAVITLLADILDFRPYVTTIYANIPNWKSLTEMVERRKILYMYL